jgi:dTDP-glucose 4,6-dehydratase
MTASIRRAVVTGGAGFVGSHICEALIERGVRVVCVDDLSTGSIGNLVGIDNREDFELVIADVSEGLQMIEGSIDAVLHLASAAAPPDYLARPLETLRAGSEGTRHALELATMHDARFILGSTSEVYGDPGVHPQPESYWGNVNPIGARSVYDEAKRFAEALTMAWHRTHGTNVGIARIFNTYGPRLRPTDGRVVSNFLVQAIEGKPLTVYGDGTQTRSLCFVDDTVQGLVELLSSEFVGIMNIGNPDEHTVLELADIVLRLTGSRSTIVHTQLPEDDPGRRCPDITVARKHLGWEPMTSLEEGLRRTADYFRAIGIEVGMRKYTAT